VKIRKVTLLIGLLFLFSGSNRAEKRPNIILLNSDTSVVKYNEAQEAFKKTFTLPVQEVNLAEKKWKISEIEDMLYNEYPDIVYCIGSKAYLVANKYVSEKDIVFSSIINWHRLPLIEKSYGVSNELHTGMQITLFRYVFPDVKKIGVLYSGQYNSQWFNKTRTEAKEMGVEIIGQAVSKTKNSVFALENIIPEINALWLISDPKIMADKKILMDIFSVCEARKIPIFSYHDIFAEYGAVLIVSVDNPTIGRQAAGMVMEVVSGEKIEEKVQYPAGSHIVLNLKKVKEYGLKYNANALSAVNKIIE
jgi:putative ABC transport system substrate-binding protein